MKRTGTVQGLICAIILTLATFGGASVVHCASETPGVTDDRILIGCTADLSGPIAHHGKGMTDGARLYFDYINERDGGVHGRRIRLLVEDDMYQSPRAMQAVRKLVTRDNVFCMFLVVGTTAAQAMYPFLEAQGIPLLFPAAPARDLAYPPRRYLFLSDPTYTTAAKVAIEFFVEDMGVREPTLAVIYQDDAPGHDWLRGVTIAARHYGLEVVQLPYRRASTDFSTQVALAKSAGATHVGIWGIIREPALILREALRQEFRATYFVQQGSMQLSVLQLAGADAVNYSSGLYGFGVVFRDNPATREYIDVVTKAGLDYRNFNYLYGWQNATIMVEALKRTGRNLTREGIIAALEEFENFDPGVNPPVTWGPGLRDGARVVGIGIARDLDWETVLPEGEWRTSSIDEY